MRKGVRVNWVNVVAFVVFHVGAFVALFFFSWEMLFLALAMVMLSSCVGTVMCFHRLLTHRSYKVPKVVEYFMTVCGTLALQGGAIWWVVVHRIHHKFTELIGQDPHTPLEGRFWAHMGWLIWNDPELQEQSILSKYAPELCSDSFHRRLNRVPWAPITVAGLLFLWIWGLQGVMWGVFVPVVFVWHSTWLVNSATHLWGSRPFQTKTTGDSRNTWWVALLAFGEGWHNNHHAFPTSARHGFTKFQFDPAWLGIRLLQLLGLATEIQLPKQLRP